MIEDVKELLLKQSLLSFKSAVLIICYPNPYFGNLSISASPYLLPLLQP